MLASPVIMRAVREGRENEAPPHRGPDIFSSFTANRRRLTLFAIALCAGALGGVALCHAADPVRVGSKRFTESYLLGEIIADNLHKVGPVEHRVGLGNTAVTLAALEAGEIDCYPEYLGTIELEILKHAEASGSLEDVNAALSPLHLRAIAPFGFADRYALAIDSQTAAREHLASISQLKDKPDLVVGLSQEFIGRADGWGALSRRYGLPQTPRGLDHGLAYSALANHEVNVIDVYTTDARILRDHLVVLDDDLHFFPNYDAVILARADLEARAPRAWHELLRMQGTISQDTMIALNSAVEIDGQDFHDVAKRYVDHPTGNSDLAPGGTAKSWLQKLFAPDLPRLALEHLRLVVLAVAAAVLIGVPLGVVASLRPFARVIIVTLTGVLQTIPSLALLAFLIPLLGRIGTIPALVALFLYGLLPIVRNTTVGLLAVSASMRDAARALGLSPLQRLWLIELPLARRVILAGIKTATVLAIGTATLAALIGAGGFGERITIGLALNDNGLLLAGAIPAAAFALLAEGAFELLDAWLARREHM